MVALPDQLLYDTGISTYFWIVTTLQEHNLRERAEDQWRRAAEQKRRHEQQD